MARPRNRNLSDFHLYSADPSWNHIKNVSYAYGEHRCSLGEWHRVHNGFGVHVGYRPLEKVHDSTVSSDPSRAALGAPEMKAMAGLMGRSRTKGLRPHDREGRVHPKSGRLLAAEDFVERTEELVKMYTQFANRGGDRAVRVYPKAKAR